MLKLLDKRVNIEINERVDYESVILEVKIDLNVPFRYQGNNIRSLTLNEVVPKYEVDYIKNNLEEFADCFILDSFNKQAMTLFDIKKIRYIENENLKNQLINDVKVILLNNK